MWRSHFRWPLVQAEGPSVAQYLRQLSWRSERHLYGRGEASGMRARDPGEGREAAARRQADLKAEATCCVGVAAIPANPPFEGRQ